MLSYSILITHTFTYILYMLLLYCYLILLVTSTSSAFAMSRSTLRVDRIDERNLRGAFDMPQDRVSAMVSGLQYESTRRHAIGLHTINPPSKMGSSISCLVRQLIKSAIVPPSSHFHNKLSPESRAPGNPYMLYGKARRSLMSSCMCAL